MKWEALIKKDDGSVIIPNLWLYPYYYEALNTLFRIENALRVFTYIILKNVHYDKWTEVYLSEDDNKQTIENRAKRRIEEDKNFGYLGYLVSCPLMYLTSGELIRLIFSDKNWNFFKSYFPGKQTIIKNKFNEINSIRNAFAHFRPISQGDIEVIKQNANQIFKKVEECLLNIHRCEIVLPTNTQDEWYKQINSLSTSNWDFSLKQSDDDSWVKVSFKFNCLILNATNFSSHVTYRVLNLITPAILGKQPDLKSKLTYLTDSFIYPIDKDNPKFIKTINMIFSKKTLIEYFSVIKSEIDSLLRSLSDEIELLRNDNLARGDLVRSTDVHASLHKYDSGFSQWFFDLEPLEIKPKPDDGPEYWGTERYLSDDIVTSSYYYPWMPIDVSETDLPW